MTARADGSPVRPTLEPVRRMPSPVDSSPQAPVVPARARLHPVGVADVVLDGGFWGERQEVNAANTLAHVEHWLEREGWLGNFDLAAADADMSDRRGREFSDSEVYKLLEAMAWELGRRPDAGLEARFDAIVRRVAAAQAADGYLGTNFGRRGQRPRYTDLEWGHELYCQGHLIQAAVARARTGHPDDLLVQVAQRSADHICLTFGENGIDGICGHAEIEVALAELGRVTGEEAYTRQAATFVERHGRQTLADIEFGRSYFQDDVPVRDATVFRGHAVRANYLAAGAIDVAVDTGDDDLLEAVTAQWRATRGRRTYLTGGQGSRHQDEGFGDDYVLPPDRAYSETCASIASVMVAWRLLLQSGRAEFADQIERTLYNVVATSPADDGRSFYYANTLHQRVPGEAADPDVASARAQSSLRAPWFHVSCCLPNVARTLASLGSYLATLDDTGVQLHQYAAMTVAGRIAGGEVRLRIDTDYPRDGRVTIRVEEAPEAGLCLSLRVPEWARTATVRTADDADAVPAPPGVLALPESLTAGDVIELDLDLQPRFVWPDSRVDAVRGCVAVERGPEVWCVESIDLPGTDGEAGPDVSRVRVLAEVEPWYEDGRVRVRARLLPEQPDREWAYGAHDEVGEPLGEVVDVALVPYHRWARRGPSTMRVWIPAEGTAR